MASMIRLYTLGSTDVVSDDGRSFDHVVSQPKNLALLTYLAVVNFGGYQRRDSLLALFWPEHDEKHARWALNQAVHRLRAELGASLITGRGPDAIGVDSELLWCDAVAFRAACERENVDEATELYRGEFFDGLHVAGCVELTQWLETQRAHYRRLAARATWAVVERIAGSGSLREAVEHARRALRLAPESDTGVRRLIALLDALGDRAGALQVFDEHAKWLHDQLGAPPAPETVAAIAAVKARSQPIRAVSARFRDTDTEFGASPDAPRLFGRVARRPATVGIALAALIAIVAVAVTLSSARGEHPRRVQSDAQLAYLKGRQQLGHGTVPAFFIARDDFRQAVDLDPTYAPAYVGLADVYNRLAIQGNQAPRDVYPLAKAALLRALELDESLADAHALLGVVKFRFDWDWRGAEHEFRRALKLDPNNMRAHLGYGMYLLATGREEALVHTATAQELDPLSPFANSNFAFHLYLTGRLDDAIPHLRSALNLDPKFALAYALLGHIYATQGVYDKATAACDTAIELSPARSEVLTYCGEAYALSGRRPDAVTALKTLQRQLSGPGYVDAFYLAALSAAISDSPAEKDNVFYWLERAYNERSANLCLLRVNPMLRRVSSDPRFPRLVQRMAFSN